MPVTGKFVADFSEFSGPADKATQDLKELEAAGEKAAAAVDDIGGGGAGLAAAASGARELGASVGGVSLSMDSLAGVLPGIGQAVGIFADIAGSVLATADEIERYSVQLGKSYGETQRLMSVADAAGVSMDGLQSVMERFAKTIGAGGAGTAGAVQKLGYELSALQGMDSASLFETGVTALERMTDATERARVGAGLFKSDWDTVSKLVAEGFENAATASAKYSDAAVEGLNNLSKAWREVKETGLEAVTVGVNFVAALAKLSPDSIGKGLEKGWFRSVYGDMEKELPAVGAALQSALIEPLKVSTTETINLGLQQRLLQADIERNKAALEKQTPAYKAWAAATVELGTVGADWQGTLEGINGEVVAAVQYYLEAGVSVGKLATAYGLTDTQARAVAESIKAANKAAADGAADVALMAAGIESVAAAWEKAAAAAAAQEQSTLLSDKTTRAYFQKLAEDAAAAFEFAKAHSDQYTAARLADLEAEKNAAAAALASWGTVADSTLTQVSSAADQAASAVRKVTEEVEASARAISGIQFQGASLAEAGVRTEGNQLVFGSGYRANLGGGMGGFGALAVPANFDALASGRSSFALNPIFAGTELARIANNVPGPSVVMQAGAVTNNYPIMNDPEAMDSLARVVGDAVMQRLSRSGLGG